MSKRVTLDEKRARMLQVFHESQQFYSFKEVERIAVKEKGIVVQAVKDVLQALVDEGIVNSAKIGSAIYFWAFPGEKITVIENRIAEANKSIVAAQFKLQKLNDEYKKLAVEREDTEERQRILMELEQLRRKETELIKQVGNFSDSDPEAIAKITEQAQAYKNAANTWTDNIFSIQSWCKRKFDITEETLNKQFRIPEDLDYIE